MDGTLPKRTIIRRGQSNVRPALLAFLSGRYGRPVAAEDVMAYVAAVVAHPAYTARLQPDLVQPGLRVPLRIGEEMTVRYPLSPGGRG